MLAIASSDPKSIGVLFVWCGILVALLLVAFALYTYFKRWMNQTNESSHVGFTLSDLREMHRQGKISDQEFEQTKAKMLSSAKKMTERMPEVLPRRMAKPPEDDSGSNPPFKSQ